MAREQEGALDYEFDRHIKEAKARGDDDAATAFKDIIDLIHDGIESGIIFQLEKESPPEDPPIVKRYTRPEPSEIPRSPMGKAAFVYRKRKLRQLSWRPSIFNS